MPESIKLTNIDQHCKASLSRNKYLLFFDETCNSHVYFSSKNYLIDLNKKFALKDKKLIKVQHF